MKRTWINSIVLTAAGALLLSVVPAFAQNGTHPPSGEPSQAEHHHMDRDKGKAGSEEHKARKLEHLKEAAKYFGISTEGKTAQQLHEELKAARTKDKAKWEQFKAEHKAMRMAKLQEKAKSLGISTEGKSMKQLCQEIHDARAGKSKGKDGAAASK
ncbi:hypothetical protein [Paenibacillus spongiae]|uniref:DUF2680 domain-containing protein n=1 Tax=Paenibacillus spongiae TaxID=2909671 RepID=A0ABY5SCP4_9BACL|nr:hypothetical protein [Paenibacillus spongiae]UVI31295.1 hypothetical protein L1F29_05475 [Paenibacillus spongiae]